MVIKPKETTQERFSRPAGIDIYQCPHCKKGKLVLIETISKARSPDSVIYQSVKKINIQQ